MQVTSGGAGFYGFLTSVRPKQNRVRPDYITPFFAISQRTNPITNAATNMTTIAARQILPSGKGPPPETRGGTQNSATTARTSAGTNKNVSKMY